MRAHLNYTHAAVVQHRQPRDASEVCLHAGSIECERAAIAIGSARSSTSSCMRTRRDDLLCE